MQSLPYSDQMSEWGQTATFLLKWTMSALAPNIGSGSGWEAFRNSSGVIDQMRVRARRL